MTKGLHRPYYRHRPDILEARLTAFERNTDLFSEGNFATRAIALDSIQQIYQLLHLYQRDAQWGRHLKTLRQQAKALEVRLRQADEVFFQTLRGQIRSGGHSAATLRQLFDRHTRYRPGRLGQVHRGYDALDALLHGLLRAEQAPATVQRHDVEMILYEPTPARAILDLVDQVPLNADDVFYDLGAGLGHVAILVHLLTGARARGVEIETAYCEHARRCAKELGLSQVHVVNRDARNVDYTDGTVFFMYTPFTGTLLDTVLATLSRVARHHPITLCTHGACTFEMARQTWLRQHHPGSEHAYALGVFNSLPRPDIA
ncbi:MAG: class I SAM-dependent methyltransferase [bacterium]|nr:class I SAM-dependent methyltransferase [bacterium]